MRKFIVLIQAALSLFLCASCNEERIEDYPETDGIRFRADISIPESPSTRADDRYYVTTEFYDCDFHLRVAGQDYEGVDNDGMSTYVIPSGYEGALIPKAGEKTLNWFSRDHEHEFWGWTMPQDQDYRPSEEDIENGITITFHDTDLSQTANSSASEWKEGVWANGKSLEQMIGAHIGPFTYVENGIYVPMHFQHIVSKIFLKNLYVINNYNTVSTSNLKGVITFLGMPGTATLYPCPKDKDGNNTIPKVVMPAGKTTEEWDYDQKSRVSYALTNFSQNYFWEGHTSTATTYAEKDCWYVCPELDFSKMEYKIEIYEYDNEKEEWVPNLSHGRQGAFYGDFSKVKFTRTGSAKYDNPGGGDETILHAGEYLELTIYLYEKGNPSVQGTIKAWTSRSGTGSSHVHQGIYSYEQLTEMNSLMSGTDKKSIEEFYEMNGSGRDTGDDPEDEYPDYEKIYGQELKILELFEDIGNNSYGTSTKLSSLYVADGYILDGQGHTVNVSSSPLTLGPVRDVYLKFHNNGNTSASILYIDKMGQVWKVDPYTFVETRTEYNVNDVDKNPFQINFSTGKPS